MNINTILEQKNMSKYKLAKKSGIPHTTVLDICSGKTSIGKCNSETVYKIAKTLDIPMEALVESSVINRLSFETFKNNVCHLVKSMTDLKFILFILETDEIRKLYNRQWYPECLYLLAMVDYLSRINDLSLCNEYNDLRKIKLKKIIYPLGILTRSYFSKSDIPKNESLKEAIPEFLQFNIVESDIRNVC